MCYRFGLSISECHVLSVRFLSVWHGMAPVIGCRRRPILCVWWTSYKFRDEGVSALEHSSIFETAAEGKTPAEVDSPFLCALASSPAAPPSLSLFSHKSSSADPFKAHQDAYNWLIYNLDTVEELSHQETISNAVSFILFTLPLADVESSSVFQFAIKSFHFRNSNNNRQ